MPLGGSRRCWLWALLAIGAIGAGACESSGPTAVTQRVGPAGGTLTLGDTATLTLPAGALATEVDVSLTETFAPVSGYALHSAHYALTPAGLLLQVPATLSLPYWGAAHPTSLQVFSATPDGGVGGYGALTAPLLAPQPETSFGQLTAGLTRFGEAFVAEAQVTLAVAPGVFLSPVGSGEAVFAGHWDEQNSHPELWRMDLDRPGRVEPVLTLPPFTTGLLGPVLIHEEDVYLIVDDNLLKLPAGRGAPITVRSHLGTVSALQMDPAGRFSWLERTDIGPNRSRLVWASTPDTAFELFNSEQTNLESFLWVGPDLMVLDGWGNIDRVHTTRERPTHLLGPGLITHLYPGGLVLWRGQLYWIDNYETRSGSVMRMDTDGGSLQALWTGPAGQVLDALTTDGTSLGWSAVGNQAALRCRLAPGEAWPTCIVQSDLPAQPQPSGMTFVRGTLCWREQRTGADGGTQDELMAWGR